MIGGGSMGRRSASNGSMGERDGCAEQERLTTDAAHAGLLGLLPDGEFVFSVGVGHE